MTTMKNGVVSVRELFDDTMRRPLDMPDDVYKIPTYSWRQPKYNHNQDKKLNYIQLFEEKTRPSLNLIKIHVKKRHEVPGP